MYHGNLQIYLNTISNTKRNIENNKTVIYKSYEFINFSRTIFDI